GRGWAMLSVEEPAPNGQLTGQVTVAGWAVNVDASGPVDEVSIVLETEGSGDVVLGAPVYGLARPDVAAAVGAAYANSGFYLAFNASGLPAGQQKLSVRVRSGQSWEKYTIPIVVGQTSIVRGPRAAADARPAPCAA